MYIIGQRKQKDYARCVDVLVWGICTIDVRSKCKGQYTYNFQPSLLSYAGARPRSVLRSTKGRGGSGGEKGPGTGGGGPGRPHAADGQSPDSCWEESLADHVNCPGRDDFLLSATPNPQHNVSRCTEESSGMGSRTIGKQVETSLLNFKWWHHCTIALL